MPTDYNTTLYTLNMSAWDTQQEKEKDSYCDYTEKVLFHEVFKHFYDLEENEIGKFYTESNVMVIDTFVRDENGNIKKDKGYPEIHSIVLWRQGPGEILVIDPSNNRERSKRFKEHMEKSVKPAKYGFKVSNLELGRGKQSVIYKPKYKGLIGKEGEKIYRECLDIAVKIAGTIKYLEREARGVAKSVSYYYNADMYTDDIDADMYTDDIDDSGIYMDKIDTDMYMEDEIEEGMRALIIDQMLAQISNQPEVIMNRIKGSNRWDVEGKWKIIGCSDPWEVGNGEEMKKRFIIKDAVKKFNQSGKIRLIRSSDPSKVELGMRYFVKTIKECYKDYCKKNINHKRKSEVQLKKKLIKRQNIDELIGDLVSEVELRKEGIKKLEEINNSPGKTIRNVLEERSKSKRQKKKRRYYSRSNAYYDKDRGEGQSR